MLHHPTGAENEAPPRDNCRTQHVSVDFSSCLTEQKKHRCNYAFLFGDGYLCTHPDHLEFKKSE
ncbi:MAG: hypothetical protein A2075_16005 [Geobacteraceae bacterium GWC2_58_44]|nr:MAG: hypothetical protein A2075_16005 [Geobacteraceae bacterium GWC2_58_44]HBG04182.1 hypothetical protein [Geobacter sp.]